MNHKTIAELMTCYPFVQDFFEQNQLDVRGQEEKTFVEYLSNLEEQQLEDQAIDREAMAQALEIYIDQMVEFLGIEREESVRSLTILPGHDKSGTPENFEKLELIPSRIISIVGPTGSGKSRLLADIEWAAQGDTPTGRWIQINGQKPDPKWRYSTNNKLVAQLSQNMNFVMDLSVGEFLEMHAQSRQVTEVEKVTDQILAAANELAGESFLRETPVTALSGGQSRALMIADTAILSKSPIVLIDEIENAGIDRRKALDLLVSQEKIVLMATHDPLLALMADQRIVIQNGGIHKVLETSKEEKEVLEQLDQIDQVMQSARQKLRAGDVLEMEILRRFNRDGEVK